MAAQARRVTLDARADMQDFEQVNLRKIVVERPGLYARQIQEVQDQVDLPVALHRYDLKAFAPLGLAQLVAQHEPRKHLDGGQRSAQLVRDAADDLRLQLVHLAEARVEVSQVVFALL